MSVGGGGAAEKFLQCSLIIIWTNLASADLAGERGLEAEARARLEWAMEFLTSQLE